MQRRRAPGDARRRRSRRRSGAAWPTSAGTSRTCASSACRRSSRSTTFTSDTDAEHRLIARSAPREFDVEAVLCRHWADGARRRRRAGPQRRRAVRFRRRDVRAALPDDMPLAEKIRDRRHAHLRCRRGRRRPSRRRDRLEPSSSAGYGGLPVCMAKTQVLVLGRPEPAGRPRRACPAGARSASGRWRRLRRRHLRRHHDDARTAAVAGGGGHPRQRRRRDRRPVLTGR